MTATDKQRLGVVAFTLYHDAAIFNEGALKQVMLYDAYSKSGPVDWKLHFYVGRSVPAWLLQRLEALGARVFFMGDLEEDCTASFWRNHALLCDYDYYLFRDVDTRLSRRERLALEEFFSSEAEFHVMRDHPMHMAPMMPGLWGCSRRGRDRINGRLPVVPPVTFYENINRWFGSNHTSNVFPLVDQIWLWRYVWPIARKRALIHSELATSRFHGGYPSRGFPIRREIEEYVGKGFDHNDEVRDASRALLAEKLAWLESGRARDLMPAPKTEKVWVKLACGFGNNIFQIVTGLALAGRLSEQSDQQYCCEVLLPDPVNWDEHYSICEALGGHLRADQHYRRVHLDYGLPDPSDLPRVLPNLAWIDPASLVQYPKENLVSFAAAQYFQTSRYYEIQGDSKYQVGGDTAHFRVLNIHFSPCFYPFPMEHWFPELLDICDYFEPGDEIANYIKCGYSLDLEASEPLVVVHVRNDQRIADIHRTDEVGLPWYQQCIEHAISETGPHARVMLISNEVAGNGNSDGFTQSILGWLRKSYPMLSIQSSTQEPYYIDFFLLRHATHLVASCSTFSFSAGLTSKRVKRLYVPNNFNERHFMGGNFPEFCTFFTDGVELEKSSNLIGE